MYLLRLLALNEGLDLNRDAARYAALAKALFEGQGYVSAWLPGLPPEQKYPPGLPALLLPFHALGGGDMRWLRLPAWLSLVALAPLTWCWARGAMQADRARAALAAMLVAGCAALANFGTLVMSELPFTALSLGALLLARRAPFRAGLLAGIAALFRTAGLSLVLALVLACAWPKRRLHDGLRSAAGALVLLVPWWLRQKIAGSGAAGAYASELWIADPYRSLEIDAETGVLAYRLLRGIPALLHHLAQGLFFFVDLLGRPVAVAVGCAALVPIAVALWRRRHALGPAEIYLGGMLVILAVWPWRDQRFLLPLLPLLFLYFAEGCSALRIGAALPAVLAVMGLLTCGHFAASDLAAGGRPHPRLADLQTVANWARDAPPDAQLLYDRPAALYLLSGRAATPTPLGAQTAPWPENATHLLLAPVTVLDEQLYARDLLPRVPGGSPALLRTPRGGVIDLRRSAAATAPNAPPPSPPRRAPH